ncbi:MAG TPA: hypothetical protein VFI95_10070 [Terriglobales bacterium]|nr:hypothetical protein [Terriglobales bacterium]
MKRVSSSALSCALCLLVWLSSALAQQTASSEAIVPHLIRVAGALKDSAGHPLTGIAGITFALYHDQEGGAALWLETQNVTLDTKGHYEVLLGAEHSGGVPMDLFSSGGARWLGIQVQGQGAEQGRILLVSVPYSLKAADADTVGGLPPSAFALAAPPRADTAANVSGNNVGSPLSSSSSPAALVTSNVTTSGGTVNAIPLFTTGTNIQNSILTQTGATAINVKGKLNHPATGTATASTGFNSQADAFVTSVFNTTSAVPITFQWTAVPANNNKTTATGTLDLFTAAGAATPSDTGLKLNNKGQFTFVAGQTYPGTITNVKAGTDLLGGGTSGVVTLNLDTTKVPQLAAANVFTANQKVNGTMTATSFSGNGTNLSGVNAANLGGLPASAYAQLAANNTFTGNNTFNGTEVMSFAFVGPFNPRAAGQLAVGSSSNAAAAIGTAGFDAANGSSQNGGDGIDTFGGGGDTTTTFNTGGTGIFAEGGLGFNGGNGVFGLGGGGGPCCIGSVDGDGGFFEGGSNSLNAGDGIVALAGSGLAGNFQGSVDITANLNVSGTKNFKIDHPLDPGNKYLIHSAVESSEMMNIYTGNVTTDTQGEATVRLPQWFEAENGDFRYQLTVIGQFAQAIISQKIANHQFTIRTSAPNVEVSWQVTGVRQDAYAKAHPLVVEQDKEARIRGFYIHPELYGAPAEKQIEWARHPQTLRQVQMLRARQAAKVASSAQGSRGTVQNPGPNQ